MSINTIYNYLIILLFAIASKMLFYFEFCGSKMQYENLNFYIIVKRFPFDLMNYIFVYFEQRHFSDLMIRF